MYFKPFQAIHHVHMMHLISWETSHTLIIRQIIIHWLGYLGTYM